MQNKELWHRLDAYHFPIGFDDKLTTEFNATSAQVRKLKEEYLRFVYLAQLSASEATPSNEIDRVWHLHLSYTRDYWDNFCHNFLGKPFHHDPCDSPASMPRYQTQYADTIALYEAEFGMVPPIQVWPTQAGRRRVLLGGMIAAIGILFMFIFAVSQQSHAIFFVISLAAIAAGVTLVFQNSSYGSRIRVASKNSGSAGCGGGGCGGGCGG